MMSQVSLRRKYGVWGGGAIDTRFVLFPTNIVLISLPDIHLVLYHDKLHPMKGTYVA